MNKDGVLIESHCELVLPAESHCRDEGGAWEEERSVGRGLAREGRGLVAQEDYGGTEGPRERGY